MNDKRDKIEQIGRAARMRVYQNFMDKIKAGEKITSSELKTLREIENDLASDDEAVGGKYLSPSEACLYLGVSRRTLSYHKKRGNLTQLPNGNFETSALDEFLKRWGKRGKHDAEISDCGSGLSVSAQKEAADLRWRLARAEREETLVGQIRGNVISKDDVHTAWAERVSEVCAGLENLVFRLPGLLEGKAREDMAGIIRGEIRALRASYAREGVHTEGGENGQTETPD